MINLFNNTYYLTNLPPSYRLITFIVQSTSKILTCKPYIDPNVIMDVPCSRSHLVCLHYGFIVYLTLCMYLVGQLTAAFG